MDVRFVGDLVGNVLNALSSHIAHDFFFFSSWGLFELLVNSPAPGQGLFPTVASTVGNGTAKTFLAFSTCGNGKGESVWRPVGIDPCRAVKGGAWP